MLLKRLPNATKALRRWSWRGTNSRYHVGGRAVDQVRDHGGDHGAGHGADHGADQGEARVAAIAVVIEASICGVAVGEWHGAVSATQPP